MCLLVCLMVLVSCRNVEYMDEKNIKARWINNAFNQLESKKYPRIKVISWWHENFDDSLLRIDSSPESLAVYSQLIQSPTFVTKAAFQGNKLVAPKKSGIYHSAFPDFGGTEDVVTSEKIKEFETLVGKDIVWAYFSNNWYKKISFPSEAVKAIVKAGTLPFIRMMPRSNFNEGGPDPRYTLQAIIDGRFDSELKQWAIDASKSGVPLLVEFGTEVNGDWFPWSGKYNGDGGTGTYGDPNLADGPERFKDAYRHIIELCNANGADNITWFFHIDAYSEPDREWNKIADYYPGNDYIDWLGVSVYGAQEPGDEFQEFTEIMNDVYPELTRLSNKPIAILEMSITEIRSN